LQFPSNVQVEPDGHVIAAQRSRQFAGDLGVGTLPLQAAMRATKASKIDARNGARFMAAG
jgi:hypothetical protein